MSKISVDDFPSGPRLDAEVARILGWTELQEMKHCDDWKGKNPEGHPYMIPRYSMDIGAAWKLVERITQKEFLSVITLYLDESATVSFEDCSTKNIRCASILADGSTIPLAITRAFLKANGVKEIEVKNDE